MSIRLRLILLVLSVLVPALAAALWVIGASYLNERDTLERNLRDTTRALSQVIERELARRATMAHVLSLSSLIDRDWAGFRDQATRAIDGIDGAVVLLSPHEQVVDTRRPPDQPPVYRAEPQPLVDAPTLAALAPDRDRQVLQAAALHPVKRNGRTVYNVAVTLLPQEVQRVLDEQPQPEGWFSAVLDSRGHVVASRPLGAGPIGQRADGDLGRMLQSGASGVVDVASLQGAPHIAFLSSSAAGTGWTFVMAVPHAQFTGNLTRAVMPAMLGMLVLCVAGVLGALWVSRGISRPVEALSRAARELKAGEPVQQRSTRIREIDEIHATLADTGTTLRRMKSDLELQVTVAVEQARRAEQRVSQSQRVEALGRLTGGVAHDFNNLLGVISNSTHVLRRAPPGPAHEASTAAILRAVEVGSRLTQHLLRFAGRQPVRPEHLDMHSYLPRVGELVKMVVGSSIRVEIETAPDTRSTTVDSSELELALINLALNARDAMPSGGTLRMHAGNAEPGRFALAPGEYVEIAVTDTGEGIAPDLVERVFEPFFTTKPTGRGTGLGLSQVHGFCRQAGGGAFVRSQVGQGTTVSMVLPAQSGRVLGGGEAAPAAQTESQQAGHVLLVEDNDDLRTSTQALLRSFGYRVSHVSDGDSALRHLAADSADIDIVLSDVVMPGAVDGIALARHVRRSERPVPVVLISGFSAAVEGQREFEVLRKPCVPADLIAALRRATRSVS